MSFGVPVLVLGDPAQLPPVAGGGFFTDAEPDVMLTEVHRQAADDPIIRLSMIVREGDALTSGIYGASRVIGRGEVEQEEVLLADQILVGRNVTRRSYNARIRQLLRRASEMPVAGDKLVCLRNDRKRGLLNGSVWHVDRARKPRKGLLRYTLSPEEGEVGKRRTVVSISPAFFDRTAAALSYFERRPSCEVGFGSLLSVRKRHGCQW